MSRDPEAKAKGYSANSYCEALDKGLAPILENDLVFMQDNAPIHTSRKAKQWFEEHGVRLLEGWPPYSPDLNPFEHLWARLKEAVYLVNPDFDSIHGLENQRTALEHVLPEAWMRIREESVRAVLESMPSRMRVVIAAKGWQTKY